MSGFDLFQSTFGTLVQAISGIQQLLSGSGGGTFILGTANSYPNTSIPVVKSSGQVSAATASASLAASATRTNWITGFDVTSSGSTNPAVVTVTVSGTSGGVLTYIYATVAGVTTLNAPLSIRFPSPIPAAAGNTAIVVSMGSLGAGNTNACITAYGYSL